MNFNRTFIWEEYDITVKVGDKIYVNNDTHRSRFYEISEIRLEPNIFNNSIPPKIKISLTRGENFAGFFLDNDIKQNFIPSVSLLRQSKIKKLLK